MTLTLITPMSGSIHDGGKKKTRGVDYVLVDYTTPLCSYDLVPHIVLSPPIRTAWPACGVWEMRMLAF